VDARDGQAAQSDETRSEDAGRESGLHVQLTALGLLAKATGEAVSPADVARSALDVLCDTMGATNGIIAEIRDGTYRIIADRRLPPALRPLMATLDVATSPVIAALRPAGSIINDASDRVTLEASVRPILERAGVRWLSMVGLHLHGEIVGILALSWEVDPPVRPRTEALLYAAASIAATLENARLLDELRASEARYRVLFERTPIGIVVSDLREGKVVSANAAAEEVYRVGPGDLIGVLLESLTTPDQVEHLRRVTRVEETGGGRFSSTGLRPDRTTFRCEIIVSRIELSGEPRTLATIRDLSEQDRLQHELAQAQKMEAIGHLMAGVAHELNNPLAAIIGFSQIIGTDPNLPVDLRQSASLLVSEAERTRRIVQNLLDFARQRAPERHATRLRPLIESIVELTAYGIGAANVEVQIDVPDELPAVPLDRQQMQQVLLNLLTNSIQAIQATGRPGHVRFAAERAGTGDNQTVRLAVSDDGPGIPIAQHGRLFVPFFTTKAPGEGTGLGLSVSFGIVEAHGGHLRYEPAADGGATFVVELPLSGAQEGADRGAPPVERTVGHQERRGDRGTVVVLDDEPAIRAFLGKALRAEGYAPVLVADGPAAVEAVREQPAVAAMLCDYRMAGMNGTDVYDAVVGVRPELRRRFVFMSGDVLNPELRSFADEHSLRLLAKPFDLETISRVVGDAVASP
jgi:PAS domain S-box-containing protein